MLLVGSHRLVTAESATATWCYCSSGYGGSCRTTYRTFDLVRRNRSLLGVPDTPHFSSAFCSLLRFPVLSFLSVPLWRDTLVAMTYDS